MDIFLAVVQIILTIAMIVLVLCQDSESEGLSGVITGSKNDSFYGKQKGKALKAVLSKLTVIVAISLLIVTLGINALHLTVK